MELCWGMSKREIIVLSKHRGIYELTYLETWPYRNAFTTNTSADQVYREPESEQRKYWFSIKFEEDHSWRLLWVIYEGLRNFNFRYWTPVPRHPVHTEIINDEASDGCGKSRQSLRASVTRDSQIEFFCIKKLSLLRFSELSTSSRYREPKTETFDPRKEQIFLWGIDVECDELVSGMNMELMLRFSEKDSMMENFFFARIAFPSCCPHTPWKSIVDFEATEFFL